MDALQAGLLRVLCFHDALEYPPTRAELLASWDNGGSGENAGELGPAFDGLIRRNRLEERRGRCIFPGREALIAGHERRERLFPRKLRRARRVAAYLAHQGGVRFVALCNTTALAHARDQGDLDFFIVTKCGTLWQTRALAAAPFKLLDARPRPDRLVRDAVCLSFFVDDSALDLSGLQLTFLPDLSADRQDRQAAGSLQLDDPYFRHWFLSLLPLYDDGVSRELWDANAAITARHPFARPWSTAPPLVRPRFQIPVFRCFESFLRRLEVSRLPPVLRDLMNRDTRVVVNGHILKFHVEDGRAAFRDAYRANCQRYGLEP